MDQTRAVGNARENTGECPLRIPTHRWGILPRIQPSQLGNATEKSALMAGECSWEMTRALIVDTFGVAYSHLAEEYRHSSRT